MMHKFLKLLFYFFMHNYEWTNVMFAFQQDGTTNVSVDVKRSLGSLRTSVVLK